MIKLATYAKTPNNAGTVALEYGLVLPIMIGLMLGVIDISRLMWTFTSLNRAVEASARWGGIRNTTSGVAERAMQEAWGINASAGDFTASIQSCGLQVSANYAFEFLIPWPTGSSGLENHNSIQLTASACYPLIE
ncbi:MAG: pilus assembly protein [Alphaproteobacteria bacterium]